MHYLQILRNRLWLVILRCFLGVLHPIRSSFLPFGRFEAILLSLDAFQDPAPNRPLQSTASTTSTLQWQRSQDIEEVLEGRNFIEMTVAIDIHFGDEVFEDRMIVGHLSE